MNVRLLKSTKSLLRRSVGADVFGKKNYINLICLPIFLIVFVDLTVICVKIFNNTRSDSTIHAILLSLGYTYLPFALYVMLIYRVLYLSKNRKNVYIFKLISTVALSAVYLLFLLQEYLSLTVKSEHKFSVIYMFMVFIPLSMSDIVIKYIKYKSRETMVKNFIVKYRKNVERKHSLFKKNIVLGNFDSVSIKPGKYNRHDGNKND